MFLILVDFLIGKTPAAQQNSENKTAHLNIWAALVYCGLSGIKIAQAAVALIIGKPYG